MKEVGVHESLPHLYDGLLAPYALSRRDRWVARLLVSCVRFPPMVALLAAWHRARSRKT